MQARPLRRLWSCLQQNPTATIEHEQMREVCLSDHQLGQFLLAPLTQWLIDGWGWVAALEVLALTALLVIPLAAVLVHQTTGAVKHDQGPAVPIPLRVQLREAFEDRSYLLIHLGFFTCGFHIGFRTTHLPGEVALCSLTPSVSANALALIGLFNMIDSIGAGWLCQRYRMKHLLCLIYTSRTLLFLLFMMAPRTPEVFYVFAVMLGLTWLATGAPTAGLVGKLFGSRHLATLFGLGLLSHQIGGFFGAWLGGATISRFGDYSWMWYADAGVSTASAEVLDRGIDLCVGRLRDFSQQGHHGEQHTGLAEAALRNLIVDPGLLQHRACHSTRSGGLGLQSLNRGDFLAHEVGNVFRAGLGQRTIHEHRACGAHGDPAPILGAGEANDVPKDPEKRH